MSTARAGHRTGRRAGRRARCQPEGWWRGSPIVLPTTLPGGDRSGGRGGRRFPSTPPSPPPSPPLRPPLSAPLRLPLRLPRSAQEPTKPYARSCGEGRERTSSVANAWIRDKKRVHALHLPPTTVLCASTGCARRGPRARRAARWRGRGIRAIDRQPAHGDSEGQNGRAGRRCSVRAQQATWRSRPRNSPAHLSLAWVAAAPRRGRGRPTRGGKGRESFAEPVVGVRV